MDIHIRHLQSFGANTEAEAFTATKQAVYTAIYGREVTDYSAIDSEEGKRTYEVYKKIVENGRKSESKFMEGTLKIRELSDWILVGENKDKIRKKIKVEANKKGKVSIRLESKVKDVKIIGLDNVEFELLDKDKKTIRKVKTDKNGNIIVEDILEGKYYLKEVKAKNGYILDNKLIEIDIKYQENIDIEISNNKIEVKAEPKPKKVERILPVTGY